MSGNYLQEFILIGLLILLNAFFSASEIAMVSIRTSKIRALAEEGNGRAKRVLRLLNDPNKFLATIQIGITLAGFLASATAAVGISEGLTGVLKNIPFPLVQRAAKSISVLVVTVFISYTTLVLGELVPKRLALGKAEQLALALSGPIDIISRIVSPFVRLLTVSSDVVIRLVGGSTASVREQEFSEDEIRLLVTENRSLRDEEKEMIAGVLQFKDTLANEIMVPRTDIIGLPAVSTIRDAYRLFKDTGLSRIPVYDGTLDNITGILTVKDIIRRSEPEKLDSTLDNFIRPAYHVPETKRVTELLRELRSENVHMAILVDEYGGTAGLVTLEDLIEEIIGEIRDEFDPGSDEHFKKLDENTALVDGIYSLEELNEKIPINLPVEEEYETVGGFMLTRLGRIPDLGDQVVHNQWTLKVEDMDGHRITSLRIFKLIE